MFWFWENWWTPLSLQNGCLHIEQAVATLWEQPWLSLQCPVDQTGTLLSSNKTGHSRHINFGWTRGSRIARGPGGGLRDVVCGRVPRWEGAEPWQRPSAVPLLCRAILAQCWWDATCFRSARTPCRECGVQSAVYRPTCAPAPRLPFGGGCAAPLPPPRFYTPGWTHLLSNVYRGLPTLPWWQMLKERRIGQLDFNIPDPFVLQGSKPLPEVSDSNLFPSPHSEHTLCCIQPRAI